jgi:hypothetical protein
MLLVVSTLSQKEAECSKPAYLHNACRTLAELWKETDCHCAPYHRDVWRSGGIGPRVINLWHNIDVCVELRAQARTPQRKCSSNTHWIGHMTVRAGMNSVGKTIF